MSAGPHPTRRPPLWTVADAVAATGGRATGDWQAGGVVIDSRQVGAGDLFVALRGDTHDAHRFVAAALAAGAAAALVDRRPGDVAADAPLLTVTDTTRGLEALGRAARARTAAAIVAVTGSVGKTGTKEMLGQALGALGTTAISQGNLNNHYGLPLSLARLPAAAAFGVVELGMNHAGEIRALTAMARPHVAIITAIAPAHIGFFDSVAGIADAKAEIFAGLEPGGTAILNRDDAWYQRLAAAATAAGAARLLGFGCHPAADVRLTGWQGDADGSRVSARVLGRPVDYRLGQPGRHWVQNSLAVLAAIAGLGRDVATAAAALETLPEMAGRGRRLAVPLPAGEAVLVDEAYNASPAACQAAFETVATIHAARGATGRKLAVLGDMLELGEETGPLHRGLAEPLLAAGFDGLIAVGPAMRQLHDALPAARRIAAVGRAADAIAPIRAALAPGDTVLVKGSLGIGMAPIVQALAPTTAAASGPASALAAGDAAPDHTPPSAPDRPGSR